MMKALWIGLNFAGLGLIVYGALTHAQNYNATAYVMGGMLCMTGSLMARKRVFRRR